MSVYRFNIEMEDDPEIKRVIEIKAEQTFEALHIAILAAVKYEAGELASFFICDVDWNPMMEIPLIDMGEEGDTPLMDKTKLKEFLAEKGQRLSYTYDFARMWNFRLELTEVIKTADAKKKYPVCISSVGDAPNQFSNDKYSTDLSLEDEELIASIAKKNHNEFIHHDDDLDLEEDWDADKEFEEEED
ncbi:MAG: hypothetical protein NTX03_02195 [Bacteroidetes bacterium]|nr:hypothetical protein [Bacteroidota bacterium]